MRGEQRLITKILLGISLLASSVHADVRVDELAKSMTSGSSKTRIAAVTGLARLEDKATLRPLVDALKDPNSQVREIAAAALGKLGHKAALPALRTAAAEDADPAVKKRAKDAAQAIAKANGLPDPWPAPSAVANTAQARSKSGGSAGFGRQAHAVEGHPNLFVTINTVADDSPGKTDKPTRKMHGKILKGTLQDSFRSSPLVTMAQADARRWGLDPRHLDLSVTKLEIVQTAGYIECEAQLRLAISDDNGKMLSFLSGGAKVQVPKKSFNQKYLPNLRKEALENAMRGMVEKLLIQLRDRSQS